jgi:oxepin-CoA hydrolase/3-oxo-5,6-dehydrosuberyl-CoA semialdehyde dehydrogenase
MIDDVQHALATRLAKTTIGDPRLDTVRMGALASLAQRDDVRAQIARLATNAKIVHGNPNEATPVGDNVAGGAFMNPVLLRTDHPWQGTTLHETEAFGPVATLMPYTDIADALALANAGKGSLVLSVFTHNPEIARETLTESAAWHGRILFADRDSAAESTGHGSPLPVLTHGGPGRAGGGEEMGGIRGVKHHMQRSALQGSPALLTKILEQQMPGAPITEGAPHPFRLRFGEITPGRSIRTASRTVTLEDIEHFAHFTGDTFYAHMDEEAAEASPIFGGRVAHGYLILSFAAGLFVDPAPGPVLANYGLENLRFTKPLKPGSGIQVLLTAKSKQLRTAEMGEVRWHATVTDETNDTVASYDLLTMNAV